MSNDSWHAPSPCYRAELSVDFPPGSGFVYRSSDNMVLPFHGPHVARPSALEEDMPSQDVVVIGCESERSFLLAGAVTAFRSLSFFTVRKRGGRFHSITVEQPHIRPEEAPEELIILRGNDWRELLVQYAEITAKKMGVPPLDTTKNLTGYCTWYYYYAAVTEQDFLENLEALKKLRGSAYSPAVAQIDDGYQPFQGDWHLQDESWKTPLRDIASDIASAGMIPGIWLMPFLASTASETFRNHPEWFVKTPEGTPRVLRGWSPEPDHLWACLDATRQEVRDHLKKVFLNFWNMGFRYFKLDALAYGLMEGVRQDPGATPVSAYRLAFEAIREAVPEAFLLGCTPPFLPSLGFVDSCRVSPDTSRYWRNPGSLLNSDPTPGSTGIANALHATVGAWWMFDRFFRADPDTLMARSDNTFHTEGEARLSVLTGILTGVSITSDHLGKITPDRLALLEKAACYRLRDARPIRWPADNWPQLFSGTVDGVPAVVVLNDGTEEREYKLDELGLGIEAEELLHPLGRISGTLRLAPHDGALLKKL